MMIERKGGAYSFDAWFRMVPPGIDIYNPAFDVTPAEYITAIITENGVVRPDFEMGLGVICMGSGGVHELAATGDYGVGGIPGMMPGPVGTAEEPAEPQGDEPA
jgi:hypothetical protein